MPSNKIYMTCDELDELVKSVYRKPYCFQQQDDCKDRGIEHFKVPVAQPYDYEINDIDQSDNHTMGVSFSSWLEREPKIWKGQPLWKKDLYWHRNFYPSIDMILNDLHSRGHLEAGDYVIEIDW